MNILHGLDADNVVHLDSAKVPTKSNALELKPGESVEERVGRAKANPQNEIFFPLYGKCSLPVLLGLSEFLSKFGSISYPVPRVLWLFGQRVGASGDSGVLEFSYRKISAVKQWKPLRGSQSKNLIFFEFSRVSTGAHPLTKKPEDSG